MIKGMISVIIPVYNVASFLPRCLDSVLAQTYTNLEIVAVDDGSSDGSGQILDQYANQDNRIRVMHKENAGVSAARADGVAIARGEYIGFVDSDDYIEPAMYEVLMKNLRQHDADISYCGHRVVYLDGTEEFFYNTQKTEKQSQTEGLTALISGAIEPGLGSKLYKTVLFEKLAERHQMAVGIRINEDLLLNYYLFSEANTLIYEDVCLYHYLKREGSASTCALSNRYQLEDPITVKYRILEGCKGTALESTAKAALLNTYINVYNALLMTAGAEWISERKQIRKRIIERLADAKLLVKRRCIYAYMIAKLPVIYHMVYRTYYR